MQLKQEGYRWRIVDENGPVVIDGVLADRGGIKGWGKANHALQATRERVKKKPATQSKKRAAKKVAAPAKKRKKAKTKKITKKPAKKKAAKKTAVKKKPVKKKTKKKTKKKKKRA